MLRTVLLSICFPAFLSAQQWQRDHIGIQLQLVAGIGSHSSNLGIRLHTYVAFDYGQLNLGTTYRFFGHNLGGRKSFGEWRHHAGIVAMAGKETAPENFIWDAVYHQSKRPYSLGYTYLWYLDKVGTSQRSGSWNLGIARWDIQMENDVFGGQAKDRFRTGTLQLSYRTETQRLAIGIRLWHGDSGNSVWTRESAPRRPNGYRDLTVLPYGKTSHGILYISGDQLFENGQVASIQVGIDDEEIRHVFQNRITHDLIIFPESVQRNTPHYPRLNKDGQMVFSRSEARPALFYFRTSLNDVYQY